VSHRGAIFALLTAALWLPELHGLIEKSMTLTSALGRMAAAVVVAYAAVSLISNVVATYQAHNERFPPGGGGGDA
jgi:hypothetical protein